MIYLNLAAPGFRKRKRKRKEKILNRLGPVYDRVNQSGKGLGLNPIKVGFDLGSKALSSKIGKRIIDKGIDNIPNIFKFGVSKIKNKNVEKVLSSDIADMVVDEAQNRVKNKFINHSAMIKEKKGKYPFLIANTDDSSEKGTHWWSILNIEPRNELFFSILLVWKV